MDTTHSRLFEVNCGGRSAKCARVDMLCTYVIKATNMRLFIHIYKSIYIKQRWRLNFQMFWCFFKKKKKKLLLPIFSLFSIFVSNTYKQCWFIQCAVFSVAFRATYTQYCLKSISKYIKYYPLLHIYTFLHINIVDNINIGRIYHLQLY